MKGVFGSDVAFLKATCYAGVVQYRRESLQISISRQKYAKLIEQISNNENHVLFYLPF